VYFALKTCQKPLLIMFLGYLVPEKMDDDANENSLTMKILEFAKNVSS
jgi:hypothetical protein